MILFPAVDIQNGNAVRLKQGKKDDSTVFASDPVEMAKKWQNAGARWLHVVDLDGAFAGECSNASIIGAICSSLDIPVQVGGGIRSMEAARQYLDAGVSRLIIGTVALENPELFARLCAAYPGRVGVSLDAANGRLKTRGWVADVSPGIQDVLPALEKAGAAFIIYTDIERDGMRAGVNLSALGDLLELTRLPVIAAGGVASMDDIKNIAALAPKGNLEGMISGRALYEKSLDLTVAQEYLDSIN